MQKEPEIVRSHKQMPDNAFFGAFASAFEYVIDSIQRTTLFFDILRQRGNEYREHRAAKGSELCS